MLFLGFLIRGGWCSTPREPHAKIRGEGVQCVGRLLVEAVEEMPVDVEDGADAGVSESLCDDLPGLSSGDEHGNVAVAQIVETAGLAD